MRRTGIAWVSGVVLLIGGCTWSPNDEIDAGGPRPAPPHAEHQPLADLPAMAGKGARAERVVSAAERDQYFELRDDATCPR